ncbi:unnamed protein product [Tilletia controversa]|uniref:Spindle assembly checkpoint component MAD1 n=3 Tax=Tilletia TaxID=13289 RepID=A0A8X7MMM2_9BASI|nr:hypothetical protein CF336_g7740 [Tilletia laevis]KAE8186064.1 hypothetical protein CF328_g7349 [Tilletia controversa]KAE8245830.1 hypothetical protein A4X03_0g7407 [Tilletia caries]KAE8186422.1 hypothetical protein CF335_g7449 [Tilletia laevis]KAE8242297.1 hypothetical protein A4X06_0g7041 [Tilletia controversa]
MSEDRNRASLLNKPAAGAGSALPRRAPSPSSAAFASASTSAVGPTGPSRISTGPAASASSSSIPTSRFGFSAGASGIPAAPASRIGQPRSAGTSALAKRTSAAAGLPIDGAGAPKRLVATAPVASQARTIPRASSRASIASAASSETPTSAPAIDTSVPLSSAAANVGVPDHLLSGPPSESAEYMLSQMKNEYERRMLVQQQQTAYLEKQLAAKVREVSKAERKLIDIVDEWETAKERMSAREEEVQTTREGLCAELEEVRKRYHSLSAQHESLVAESQQSSTTMHTELVELRSGVAQLQAEREKLAAEVGEARERAAQAEEEREVLEKVLEEQSAKGLEREEKAREVATGWGTREEAEAVEKEIKRQALHVRALEETVAKLKAENKFHVETATNIELLREEKRSLESKLRGMEELRHSLAAAESKAQEAVEINTAWTGVIEGTLAAGPDAHVVAQMLEAEADAIPLPAPPASPLTPSTFQTYLRQLLAVQSGLSARVLAAAQRVSELKTRLAETEEKQAEHAMERDRMGRELAEEKASGMRALRAEERLKGEVTRFKDILASYEAEQQAFKGSGNASGYDEAAAARIKSLESLVEEQNQQCDNLGAELEAARRDLAGAQEAISLAVADAGAAAKVKELNQALEAAKAEYDQLFKDAEQLSLENDKLLVRVGRGEFDESKEKCWSLTGNPASRHFAVRTATLDALKKENEDLLKRLDELNAKLSQATAGTKETSPSAGDGVEATADDQGGALVPRQVVENFKKDIQDLQKAMQAKDKAMLRLKQVFTVKATEFREAVQSLFGYKIRFLENGKVKLSSVYALSSKGRGTNIIFQSNGNNKGQMRILLGDDEEDGGPLKDLQWLKEYWLGEERQNVPCFLAALSKELYEAVTRVEKRGAWRLESGEGLARDGDAQMQE